MVVPIKISAGNLKKKKGGGGIFGVILMDRKLTSKELLTLLQFNPGSKCYLC